MLSRLDFEKRFEKELRKYYSNYHYNNGILIIDTEQLEMTIPLTKIYEEYKSIGDFTSIIESYINTFVEMQNFYNHKVDNTEVFPFIKHSTFLSDSNLNMVRENLFLDIDLFYVSDLSHSFRFTLQDEIDEFDSFRVTAFQNLNLLMNRLKRIDEDLEIYTLEIQTDFAATLLLSNIIQRQIKEVLGNDFLFAIPSSSLLIVSKNRKSYMEIIDCIIKYDKDPHKISSAIYHWTQSGKVKYASSPIMIIK